MKNKKYICYYTLSLAVIVLLSIYPLMMGIRVLQDMLSDGTVLAENYPKYLIPYTPVSLAVIFGTVFEPILSKLFKKISFAISSVLSLAVFFVTEFLLENLVIVTETVETKLESWQMYMCYVTPTTYTTRTRTAIDVLIGEYSPFFKLHFYFISVLIIISVLNCIYGFADVVRTGNKERSKRLFVQGFFTAVFTGLCILACFTAFYRTGEILISPLSATLMTLFFVVFGLTAGFFVSSFTLEKKSNIFAPLAASLTVLLMYIGEMILLGGKLYRYGKGFFFAPCGKLVLSLCDIVIIAASGALCFGILKLISKKGE